MLARAFLILNCKTLTICDNHMLNRKLMWKDLREIRRRRWFSGLVSKIRCRRKFSEIFDYVSPRKTLLEANSRRPLPACQSSANFSPIARQRVSRGSFCSPIGGANNAATLQSGDSFQEVGGQRNSFQYQLREGNSSDLVGSFQSLHNHLFRGGHFSI